MASFSDFLSARGISQVAKSSNILDATGIGRAVLTAATAAAQLSVMSANVLSVSGSNITISGQTAATQAYVGSSITSSLASFGGQTPIGGVIRYFGAIANVPANWHILDGSTVTINGQSVTLPDTRGIFTIGAGPANAVGSTGGAASNTPTISGTALTTDQLPAHNHAITDPGHAHSISDPGHAHGVSDGGHAHQTACASTAQLGNGSYGSPSAANSVGYKGQLVIYGSGNGFNVGSSGAGIGIYGAGTGIGIYSAATGITIQNTGSGNTHTHTASAVPTIPPYVALYDIIRMS